MQVWARQLPGNIFTALTQIGGGGDRGAGRGCSGSIGILAATSTGAIHCVNATIGAAMWHLNLGCGPISAPPAIMHLMHRVECLQQYAPPAAIKGANGSAAGQQHKGIHVAVTSNQGCISILRLPSGGAFVTLEPADASNLQAPAAVRVLGSFQMPAEVFSAPVFMGGSLFFGCRDDRMYAIKTCIT